MGDAQQFPFRHATVQIDFTRFAALCHGTAALEGHRELVERTIAIADVTGEEIDPVALAHRDELRAFVLILNGLIQEARRGLGYTG